MADAGMMRVPARAVTSLLDGFVRRRRLARGRRGALRRTDDRSRSHRRRRPRHLAPAAICAPAEGARLQRPSQYHRDQIGAGDGFGRWRQRHGASRYDARRQRGDRHGARHRCGLGRRAPLQSRRAGRALCGNADGARHDRVLCRGRQRQSHGDLGRHRFVARHQSAGHRRALGRGPAGARHGDLDRRLRHGEEIRAARADHAGRLVRQARDWRSRLPIRTVPAKAFCCRWANTRAPAWR